MTIAKRSAVRTLVAATLTAALSLSATQAVADAAPLTCADFNISTTDVKSSLDFIGTVSLKAGDTLRFTANSRPRHIPFTARTTGGSSGIKFECGKDVACDDASATAPLDGTADISVQFSGSADVGTVPGFEVRATCSPAATATETFDAPAKAAGASIGAAIGNAIDAQSSGGAEVSRNGMFFTAPSDDGAGKFWGAFDFTTFKGDLDGQGIEFTLGADRALAGGGLIGVVASYGAYDMDEGGVITSVNALTFGPYFSMPLGESWSVKGYATVARPEYDVDGTAYVSQRATGEISLANGYDLGAVSLDSYLTVRGFSEQHPDAGALSERRIQSMSGLIGTRATFDAIGAITPRFGVAAVFNKTRTDDDPWESFVSPHVELGFVTQGEIGSWSLNFAYDEVSEGTRSYGVNVGYAVSF